MNCLLALNYLKSVFHFIPYDNIKKRFFDFFQEVWKWNNGLQLVKVILNNFMNDNLIFMCSYPKAQLYSVALQYASNGT